MDATATESLHRHRVLVTTSTRDDRVHPSLNRIIEWIWIRFFAGLSCLPFVKNPLSFEIQYKSIKPTTPTNVCMTPWLVLDSMFVVSFKFEVPCSQDGGSLAKPASWFCRPSSIPLWALTWILHRTSRCSLVVCMITTPSLHHVWILAESACHCCAWDSEVYDLLWETWLRILAVLHLSILTGKHYGLIIKSFPAHSVRGVKECQEGGHGGAASIDERAVLRTMECSQQISDTAGLEERRQWNQHKKTD